MKFKLPDGTTAISVGGREVGAPTGIVDLPEHYAADLARHGCRTWQGAKTGMAVPSAASPRQRRAKD